MGISDFIGIIASLTDAERQVKRTARDFADRRGMMNMGYMVHLKSVYTSMGNHDMHTLVPGQRVTGISIFR